MNWLVLDCNYLCHRAHHATGDLSHNGEPTGVAFGFLTELVNLVELYRTRRVVFCWDMGVSIRRDDLAEYKASRHKLPKRLTPEERHQAKAEAKRFRYQVRKLREVTLPDMGWPNILCQPRLEADDFIAAAAYRITRKCPESQVTIVTADQDLYQCIRGNVQIYNPRTKQPYTLQSFYAEWGLEDPTTWAWVKAAAGCSGDGVPGIRGVGDKTAAKAAAGLLRGKKLETIESEEGQAIINRNLPLVRLPHQTTPRFKLYWKSDIPTCWRIVCLEMGMKRLAGADPRRMRA